MKYGFTLAGRGPFARTDALSAIAIAAMPLAAWQTVVHRMIWPDILSFIGYGIGGAIAIIIGLRLDSTSQAAAMRQTATEI